MRVIRQSVIISTIFNIETNFLYIYGCKKIISFHVDYLRKSVD